ncbi:probable G-protein coupled receptor Mth-like 4 [Leguminivora glycinivorella]|uniref:probable G-protein coupled receptor Mth-like 4 n=1 Tax=Leguminivora glycinivorella TaxID=1035111 RepID=UPI00200EAD2E|nr:probable G-protein coupled receptor Mth-like 4 [Leguminivora glycinivorella]XP_047994349.1 probable G-protein coupled receptor Mth-like 4 [Leguminivora glycinivorella]
MKAIIIYLTLVASSLAYNASYCCPEKHVIWVDNNNLNHCLDNTTNATMKITLNCLDNLTFTVSNEFLPFKLNPDGSLGLLMGDMSEVTSVAVGDFCVGRQTTAGEASEVAIICQSEIEDEIVSDELLGYCMALSSVFLALTALVYAAFPELRDLQGKSITCLCSTQAISNVLFCIMKVMMYSHMTWCAIRGFLAYYFNISTFFWMNAIAIQILINMKYSLNNDSLRKFLLYALYAWGAPAVLTSIVIIVNYVPGSHMRPGIGYNQCWFLDIKRTWIYMYSVLTILMSANVAIFVYASVFLWKQTFASSHLQALRHKSWMMFRLFIIMGLPWIFEMVTSLTPAHGFWVVLDIINCLQGLIVFLILVVFRRRVIKALYNRNALLCLTSLAENYLKGSDDEEDIVTPTAGVPMEETGAT